MNPFRRRRRDRELAEELEAHLAMRAEWSREAGMPSEAARADARRRFGSTAIIYEETRRMHVNQFLETAVQDLRYAFRGFARDRAFTLSAVLALALGIGGATAVFSVVDRVLFRALPYPEPDRLVSVGLMTPLDSSEFLFSGPYLEWKRTQTPFESMTSFGFTEGCDLTEANPVRLTCARLEADFLATLRIQPIGRSFTAAEDVRNGPEVALASYGFWQSRLGGDPNVAGKAISVNGAPMTIVGVLPAGFEMPRLNHAELFVPVRLNRNLPPGQPGRELRVYARLKPGVTIAQAREAMAPLFAQFLPTVPPAFRQQVSLRIRSVRDLQTEQSRLASWLLLGAVGALLAIACANVANLLLARSARRRRELAVRAAIGASRARVLRQALTESLALALGGGIVGCGLAFALLRAFIAIAPSGILRLEEARLDWRALAFSLAAMVSSGILFGLAPALESPRVEDLTGARSVGGRRSLFRQMLVAAQIAVSLVLLTGATLLMRSLWNLQAAPLGFQPEHAVAATFELGPSRYPTWQRQQAFFERLEARATSIPGTRAAAISDSIPPAGGTRSRPYTSLLAEGHERYTRDTGGMIAWRFVTPDYFAALGIPLVRGRGFTEDDREPGRDSTILSQTLAQRLFPGEQAVGRRVRFGDGETWYTVVGIAANVRNSGVTEPAGPEYYLLRRHGDDPVYAAPGCTTTATCGWRAATVILRTTLSPRAAAASLRGIVGELEPTLPVRVQTLDERVSQLAVRPRFDTALVTLFAAMGLLLAAVGLYGVMAFLVAQRTPEIGLRMAIGASPGTIAASVIASAARWTAAGVVLGIAGSIAAARAIRTMLFGVDAHDPLSLAIAVAVLAAVALAAAWAPARRAASIDPLEALRVE
jgi:predicted permease